ncbi:pyridoxal phosphate-dependent transferase [Chlamydoabsidia padenii]|nr:pyridoxal phosphate-dependent transferase [Chlamydoabsidia padenii]
MISHILKPTFTRSTQTLANTFKRWITYDLTSDTATQPTDAMFEAMKSATKADDVFGVDETTNELQQRVAILLGHEAGLFCASGSMTNQLGLRVSLHQPPHSVLADARSHINLYECGGLAYHSQASLTAVQPQGMHLAVKDIEQHAIRDDLCGAITKVVAVENTLNGTVMPLDQLEAIREYTLRHGYKLHMDGARLWDASIASGLPLAAYGRLCDTVSICLSKGLGAPIGSVLVGDHATIKRARHLRKLMGGGWRQAGGLASAALYCMEHVLPMFGDTHRRTQKLWEGLKGLGMGALLPVETNMIFIDTRGIVSMRAWAGYLKEQGGILVDDSDDRVARLVLHYQITDQVVDRMLGLTRQFVRQYGTTPTVDDNKTIDVKDAYPSAKPQ